MSSEVRESVKSVLFRKLNAVTHRDILLTPTLLLTLQEWVALAVSFRRMEWIAQSQLQMIIHEILNPQLCINFSDPYFIQLIYSKFL
jgi:hypothetical protein